MSTVESPYGIFAETIAGLQKVLPLELSDTATSGNRIRFPWTRQNPDPVENRQLLVPFNWNRFQSENGLRYRSLGAYLIPILLDRVDNDPGYWRVYLTHELGSEIGFLEFQMWEDEQLN